MKRKKVVLWGGNWNHDNDPLEFEKLDSHAAINAYFLGKALERYFQLERITGFYRIGDALQHRDAHAILSTFQAGFTVLDRKEANTFRNIHRVFRGRLCSITDFCSWGRAKEDILFTLAPKTWELKSFLRRLLAGSRIYEKGWCASPGYCKPMPRKNRLFTIFIDHGNYGANDHTHIYTEALSMLAHESSLPPLQVYYQGNRGVQQWRPGKTWHFEKYDRAAKVPWPEILDYYRKTDIFCVTHWEGGGQAALEAAMSGATLYVPALKSTFLRPEFLSQGVNHRTFACNASAVATAFRSDILKGINNEANHKVVAHLNWDVAASRIYHALAL